MSPSTYHLRDGLCFQRLPDLITPAGVAVGRVRIFKVAPGDVFRDEAPLEFVVEVSGTAWASVIASLTPEGETQRTFDLAAVVHGLPR